jgi:hypothetical protein
MTTFDISIDIDDVLENIEFDIALEWYNENLTTNNFNKIIAEWVKDDEDYETPLEKEIEELEEQKDALENYVSKLEEQVNDDFVKHWREFFGIKGEE